MNHTKSRLMAERTEESLNHTEIHMESEDQYRVQYISSRLFQGCEAGQIESLDH